jgi:hypothetical protein
MRRMISTARRRPGAPLAGAPPAAALDRIRWGGLGLAVAAGLALATGAGAADIPNSTHSTVQLLFANNSLATRVYAFETARDSDWFRVRLKGGMDYYVTGLYGEQGDGSVLRSTFRDATGKVLAQPGGDCRRGVTTKCTMRPGQARDNNVLGSGHDVDSFRLALTAGRTYTFFVGAQQGCASDLNVSLADSTGTFLAAGQPVSAAGYDYAARLVFRAPRPGTYFASVYALDDCEVLYRFRMR